MKILLILFLKNSCALVKITVPCCLHSLSKEFQLEISEKRYISPIYVYRFLSYTFQSSGDKNLLNLRHVSFPDFGSATETLCNCDGCKSSQALFCHLFLDSFILLDFKQTYGHEDIWSRIRKILNSSGKDQCSIWVSLSFSLWSRGILF